jgi:DNA-binding PucR family transcriptional regulator
MWQVLLGFYIVVATLSASVLWFVLAMAKKADRDSKRDIQPQIRLRFSHDYGSTKNQAVELSAVSKHSEE